MKTILNMKKILLILAVVFVGQNALAQDTKAKDLLNEVSSKVKTYDNIYIDFKYDLTNEAQGVSQETRGDVTLSGDKYRLELMGTTQIYDGKKVYTIVPEDEQVTISSQNPEDDNAITPSKMLTFFNEGYTYAWDIAQNVNGRKIQYVQLTPMDSDSELKSALLGIDAQTKHVYRLIMTQKNGTKITITVNSFKPNHLVADNLFVFDKSKYPDFYIDDLD